MAMRETLRAEKEAHEADEGTINIVRLPTETEQLKFFRKNYYFIDAPTKVDKVEVGIRTTMSKSKVEIEIQTEDYIFS